MKIWKVSGFAKIPNSIKMKPQDMYVKNDNFEEAMSIAAAHGCQNIFRTEEVTEDELPYLHILLK